MLYRLLCASVVGIGVMIGAAHAGGIMVIQHKVSNYTNWRPAFDADKANQEAAGLTNPHVYQSVDSANEVTITFDMADANKAKAFGSSKALKETMVKAGVVGKPALSYLNPAQ